MTSKVPSDVSLQVLSCLEALVAERSVTRAAERTGLSQPTMSRALARLRVLFKDPLLVRTSHGMEATPRAKMLVESIKSHLNALAPLFANGSTFDPAAEHGELTIATTDTLAMRFMPTILERIGREAPNLRFFICNLDVPHMKQWLDEGVCDIGMGVFLHPNSTLRYSELCRIHRVCISSQSHPDIGETLSLDQYTRAQHVQLTLAQAANSSTEYALDDALQKIGRERKLTVRVQSSLLVGGIVAKTNLIATVNTHMARHFAQYLPIRIHELPFAIPDQGVSMIWHERTHQLELHQWVRNVIRDVTGEMG